MKHIDRFCGSLIKCSGEDISVERTNKRFTGLSVCLFLKRHLYSEDWLEFLQEFEYCFFVEGTFDYLNFTDLGKMVMKYYIVLIRELINQKIFSELSDRELIAIRNRIYYSHLSAIPLNVVDTIHRIIPYEYNNSETHKILKGIYYEDHPAKSHL